MDINQRNDESWRRRRFSKGEHPRDVAQRAVEAELAAEGQAVGAVGREVTRRHQQPDGDGEIESRTGFADT
jgi:hypothetical protein